MLTRRPSLWSCLISDTGQIPWQHSALPRGEKDRVPRTPLAPLIRVPGQLLHHCQLWVWRGGCYQGLRCWLDCCPDGALVGCGWWVQGLCRSFQAPSPLEGARRCSEAQRLQAEILPHPQAREKAAFFCPSTEF